MKTLCFLLLCIGLLFSPSFGFSQIDGGDLQLDTNNFIFDVDFNSTSGSGPYPKCGPCSQNSTGISSPLIFRGKDTIIVGTMDVKMGGMRHDSCNVEVSYSIYRCGPSQNYPVLTIDGVKFLECDNGSSYGLGVFPVASEWMDQFITKSIRENIGNILTVSESFSSRFGVVIPSCISFYSLANNTYVGDIMSCDEESPCCLAEFRTQRDPEVTCAIIVSGAKAAVPGECLQTDRNWITCSYQCDDVVITGFESPITVRVNP